jgi:hypothetical protein
VSQPYDAITEVEAMIFARLFGKGRWLADRETAVPFEKRCIKGPRT